jgi:hypothetical protein
MPPLAASAARIEKMIAADMAADPAQFEGAALLAARAEADDRAFRAVMSRNLKHAYGKWPASAQGFFMTAPPICWLGRWR